MSAITQKLHRWFDPEPRRQAAPPRDAIGEAVKAAVAAQARAKSEASARYDKRVQTMIDELFLRMRKADPDA